MVKNLFLKINVFVLAATIICILLYSNLFVLKDKNYVLKTLLPLNEICEINGTVSSSPVKLQNGKFYSVKFKVLNVKNDKNGIFSANGIVNLFLPTKTVEALFPGKLYSSSIKSGAVLADSGANLSVKGRFSTKTENKYNCSFYADFVNQLSWGNGFFSKLNYIRSLLRLQFKRLLYAWGASGALLLALITGMREYTDVKITTAFKNSGLSHILALSGMHLSLFGSISNFFTRKLFGKRKIALFFEFFAVSIFVFFAGLSPSLCRALLCSSLSIFLRLLGIKNCKMINILSFVFLFHILIFPEDYKNAGFILSYGALTGILLFSEILNSHFSKIVPEKLSSSFCASLSAQIFTSPISLKLFGTFAPIGIISSVIVTPVVTLFIYLGLFFITLCLIFPFFSECADFLLNLLYNLIEILVLFFSKFKIFSIN